MDGRPYHESIDVTQHSNKPPTRAQKAKLLEQVDALVLNQTNVFIRELLRELGHRPGANKAEFRENLESAIEEGKLTKSALDAWLHRIEGWGNQHVYAFEIPEKLAKASIWARPDKVQTLVEAQFPKTWNAQISSRFPEDPKLARVSFDGARQLLLLEWQERYGLWIRDSAQDDTTKLDGDEYWFKAFRRQPGRAVHRFVLLLSPTIASKPIAALFLRAAVETKDHRIAVNTAWDDLAALKVGKVGLDEIQNRPWDISSVIKKLDDDIVHDKRSDFQSRGTVFREGLASVEFVSSPDMTLPERIRDVRLSIPSNAINDTTFIGSKGDFERLKDADRHTSRKAHVQLIQKDNRIRIWTELDETDVWSIIESLDGLR